MIAVPFDRAGAAMKDAVPVDLAGCRHDVAVVVIALQVFGQGVGEALAEEVFRHLNGLAAAEGVAEHGRAETTAWGPRPTPGVGAGSIETPAAP